MPSFRNRFHDEILAYSFLWPSLLILVALLIYPLGEVIRLSFYDSNLQRETWVGLGNYAALMDDPLFWQAFGQTVVFTAASVALHLVIGLGLALLLNMQLNETFRSLARGLLIVPWLLAPTVAGMIWVLMLAPFGVFNGLLARLGFIDINFATSWLGDPATALGSVTAMNVWRAFPFFMVMLLAGLQAIPKHLYEAADIDGASGLQKFWHITLPQLRGVITTIVLLDSIWTFRAFDPVFVMTGGGPAHSSEVLATVIYFDGFQKLRFGYASAEAMVMFIVLFVVSAIYVRRTMSKEH
ncbi:multiple sugar transport system permease protein [Chelatococcus caeni]|uniref:Multiple sugar transport system permease protein n=1 Tax=Chelatococcus caeni TaxID=1348468 RepID=A0A840C0E3_9HYPH|nr:sugar ABC transporter permease [Chelatococcus caeni]MBB4018944.1 multiple sugar transport system permease protein [Chelatococcus caeni]